MHCGAFLFEALPSQVANTLSLTCDPIPSRSRRVRILDKKDSLKQGLFEIGSRSTLWHTRAVSRYVVSAETWLNDQVPVSECNPHSTPLSQRSLISYEACF